jgi:outer membrane protein assembly factor BamB
MELFRREIEEDACVYRWRRQERGCRPDRNHVLDTACERWSLFKEKLCIRYRLPFEFREDFLLSISPSRRAVALLCTVASGCFTILFSQGASAQTPDVPALPTRNVLTFHGKATRAGSYVVPALTWDSAKFVRPDQTFHPSLRDHIYAQPLYWQQNPGRALLLVATESDNVFALDAATGATVWETSLGDPAPHSAVECGDIDPLGVTGTPVIDPKTNSIYVGAMIMDPKTKAPRQKLFALSLESGAIESGWPIDVADALAAKGFRFDAKSQNERGALGILDGVVYVPYGSTWDCGDYRGWVVGVKIDDPTTVMSFHTQAHGAGIWSPGGVSSDKNSLYVATGDAHNKNGTLYDGTIWKDSEAILRLQPDLSFDVSAKNYFTPSYWRSLDMQDEDMSGSAPVLFTLGNQKLAFQVSKDNDAYLVDRQNLGGIGGSIADRRVSTRGIITTPTVYKKDDYALVTFQAPGSNCPASSGKQPELTTLAVRAGSSPSISTAWCATLSGNKPLRQLGAPIVTTTNGSSDPVVWILGAEDDNRLYAFQGETGEMLFQSDPLSGLHRFQSLIATEDKIYVAGDGNVYAFNYSSKNSISPEATNTSPMISSVASSSKPD